MVARFNTPESQSTPQPGTARTPSYPTTTAVRFPPHDRVRSGFFATFVSGRLPSLHIESVFALSFLENSPKLRFTGQSSRKRSCLSCIHSPTRGIVIFDKAWSGLFIVNQAFGDAFEKINRTSFHVFLFYNRNNSATGERGWLPESALWHISAR